MGVIAVIVLAGALVSISLPAAGQQAETLEPAALTGTIDPASIIDVGSFSARADAWAAARVDQQELALARAVALAAETKAAEEAERARLEAEEAHRAQEEEARRAAEEAAAATTTTSTTTTTTTTTAPPGDTVAGGEGSGNPGRTPPSGAPTPEQWQALRQCESGNNYTAVSSSGRYRGAYQFSIPTWDWLAGARHPELAGIDPIDASPADQDKMAHALYDVHGKSPWPVCGQHLP